MNNFFVLHFPPPSSKSFLMVLPQAKRVLQQVPWCPCISWLPRKLIQSGVSIQVTCNNLVYCKIGLNVDGKTCNITFNTFFSKVAKQGKRFCCPFYCSFSLGKLATCADFVARVQLLSTFCNNISQPTTTWVVAGQVWFVGGKTPVNSFSSNIANKVARFFVAYLTVPEIRLYTFFFVSDVKYPKVPNWTTFFQSSVSRVLLTLVGSPPSSHPGNTNDPNRSVDTVPVSDKPAPQPQMNSPVMNGKHVYCNLPLRTPPPPPPLISTPRSPQ